MTKVTVVIDGANVCTLVKDHIDIVLLSNTIKYFQQNHADQVNCVAFVPNFWLNIKPKEGTGNAAMQTDEWDLLNELVQKQFVSLTPSQAHDDLFIIDYAFGKNGFIVTNDMFRDHVGRMFHGRRLTASWIRKHCIDFTFVHQEFVPNSQAMHRLLTSNTTGIHHNPPQRNDASHSHGSIDQNSHPSLNKAVGCSTQHQQKGHSRHHHPPRPLRSHSGYQHNFSDRSINAHLDRQFDNRGTYSDSPSNDKVQEELPPKQTTKRIIDMSEVEYLNVPSYIIPIIRGENDTTLKQFQDYSETYIVLPARLDNHFDSPATISIFGSPKSRQKAIVSINTLLQTYQPPLSTSHHHSTMDID